MPKTKIFEEFAKKMREDGVVLSDGIIYNNLHNTEFFNNVYEYGKSIGITIDKETFRQKLGVGEIKDDYFTYDKNGIKKTPTTPKPTLVPKVVAPTTPKPTTTLKDFTIPSVQQGIATKKELNLSPSPTKSEVVVEDRPIPKVPQLSDIKPIENFSLPTNLPTQTDYRGANFKQPTFDIEPAYSKLSIDDVIADNKTFSNKYSTIYEEESDAKYRLDQSNSSTTDSWYLSDDRNKLIGQENKYKYEKSNIDNQYKAIDMKAKQLSSIIGDKFKTKDILADIEQENNQINSQLKQFEALKATKDPILKDLQSKMQSLNQAYQAKQIDENSYKAEFASLSAKYEVEANEVNKKGKEINELQANFQSKFNDPDVNNYLKLLKKKYEVSVEGISLIDDPRFTLIKEKEDKYSVKQQRADEKEKLRMSLNSGEITQAEYFKQLKEKGYTDLSTTNTNAFIADKLSDLLKQGLTLPRMAGGIFNNEYGWTDKLADVATSIAESKQKSNPYSSDMAVKSYQKFAQVGDFRVLLDEKGNPYDVRDSKYFSIQPLQAEAILEQYKQSPGNYTKYNQANASVFTKDALSTIADVGIMIAGTKGLGSLVKGGTLANTIIGSGISFAQIQPDIYEQAINSGLNPQHASQLSALVSGGISIIGLINPVESKLAGGGGLFGGASKIALSNADVALINSGKLSVSQIANKYIKGIAKNILGENFEEVIAEPLWQDMISNIYKSQLTENSEGFDKQFDPISHQGLETALLTSVVAIPFGIAEVNQEMPHLQSIALQTAIDNPDIYNQILEQRKEKGLITEVEMGAQMLQMEEISSIYNSVKDEIKKERQPELIALLAKKNVAQNKIAEIKDDVLSTNWKSTLEKINNDIQNILNDKPTVNNLVEVEDLIEEETPVAQENETPIAQEGETQKVFSDFDNTLYDPQTGELTELGEQMKERIANGEDIEIVTAREDTPENRKLIADKLGIDDSKISMGLTPEMKAEKVAENEGESQFIDDNTENLNAVTELENENIEVVPVVSKVQSAIDKLNARFKPKPIEEEVVTPIAEEAPTVEVAPIVSNETKIAELRQERDDIKLSVDDSVEEATAKINRASEILNEIKALEQQPTSTNQSEIEKKTTEISYLEERLKEPFARPLIFEEDYSPSQLRDLRETWAKQDEEERIIIKKEIAQKQAELKALEQQPTSTNQSESNPALRDVESTAKAFKDAGEKSKKDQSPKALGNFIIDNSKVGDKIIINEDSYYEVVSKKTNKKGQTETELQFFAKNDDTGKFENIPSAVKLFTDKYRGTDQEKLGYRDAADLFESSYTNSKGERVTEQSTYEPKSESLLSKEQSTSTTQSEIEAKKADIERRRQGELISLLPKDKVSTGNLDFSAAFNIGIPEFYQQMFDMVKEGKDTIAGVKESNAPLLQKLYNEGKLKDKKDVWLALNPEAVKINAKYDAELKALEQQSTSTTQSESTTALRDVESTAKALEVVDKDPITKSISGIPLPPLEIGGYKRKPTEQYNINDPQSISEAYHKAKADGSNPELVKAVESLLSKEQTSVIEEIKTKDIDNKTETNETSPKKIITNKKIEIIDKEIDDIWEHFGKMRIIVSPEQEAKDMQLSIRLTSLYLQKGFYKLSDIVQAGIEKLGEIKMQQILPFIKNGYLAYQSDATDDALDKMDDIKYVRSFTIKNNKNENTRIDLDRNELDSIPKGKQQEVLVGFKNEKPTTNESNRETGGVSTKSSGLPKTRPTTRGSGGISDGNTLQLVEPIENFVLDESKQSKTFNKKSRFDDNLSALKILVLLLKENRNANNLEQDILSKYVGFGGLKVVLNNINTRWNDADEELRQQVIELNGLIKDLEQLGIKNILSAIKQSTATSHYTPIGVIKGIYKAIEQFGFTGGHVLDPSAGIGHFTGVMPLNIRNNSKLTQVELDPLTGEILKKLYPKSTTHIKGFQEANLPNNYYDLVVSNMPFGKISVFDPLFKSPILKQFTKKIHNYFFAKSLQQAKEGGVIAFVTSSGVLDSKSNQAIRQYIKNNAEFIGAIRLPSSTFEGNANTSVVSDIIFIRKTSTPNNINDFLNTVGKNVEHKNSGEIKRITINEYFDNNPQNVIGTFKAGGQYSENDMTLIADENVDIQKEIEKIIESNFPKGILGKTNNVGTTEENIENISTDAYANAKVGEVYVDNDGNAYIKDDENGGKTMIAKTHKLSTVKDYINLRDALILQYKMESNDYNSKEIEENRRALNKAYDIFIKNNGILDKNKSLLLKDINGFNVLSLENTVNKKQEKADIFNKRVIQAIQRIDKVDNINDAIHISINEYGNINIDRVASLLGQNSEQVVLDNYGILFYDTDGKVVSRDEYLSGNVKKKLTEAIEIAKENELYKINVKELQEVIPSDIEASQIDVNIGSRWIPAKYYESFINQIFNTKSNVEFSQALDKYKINAQRTVESDSKYGTTRKNGIELLEQSMMGITSIVYDTVEDLNGKEKKIVNKQETQLAQEKQQAIKDAFQDWIWRDEDRREVLGNIYNYLFNTTVKRNHDGTNLNFDGLNNVTLMQHQKDAIAMLINNNGGIIDHIVGAGKTYVMIAGAMKMKQIGLVNKPCIIGLKSTIPHLISDAKKAYPNARILTPTESDFNAKNRKRFLSKIQNNDWDIIIMSHEQFSSIPQDVEIQIETINEELGMLDKEIADLERESGNTASKQVLKGLEARKNNLANKLKELADVSKDKEILNFKQIGIDHLMVDESQMFKNLEYSTRINKIAGLGNKNGSKRAFNMLTAIRTLQKMNNGDNGVTFLSGTPISNSLVEMYLLFKYLRPNKMNELGYNTFDAWVTQFAEATNEIEFSVSSAVKQNMRFRKFINLPELSMLYNEIADVRNDSNLKLKKPIIKGYIDENGNKVNQAELIAVPQSDYQKEWTKRIIEFANQNHGNRDGNLIGKGELSDSQQTAAMLMVTNLSNKLSIDMRLIDKTAEDNPTGKLSAVANNVSNIYKETSNKKGTQLIFCDTGTPKTANTVENLKIYLEDELNKGADDIALIFGEEGVKLPPIKQVIDKMESVFELSQDEVQNIVKESRLSEGQFNVYNEVKRKLIANGIPSEQIVFIHDYKTKKQKEDLFKAVNSGDIRIVIGSTQKLGTGVNAQKKIVALHHIDASWNPASMEQRNGRGIRQGNENTEVGIYNYGTELTLDAYKYQLIATKQKFINQVKNGEVGGERSVKEGDGEDMGAQAMVAILSGNPLLMELAKIDNQVDRLKRSKRSYDSEKYSSESQVKRLQTVIPIIKKEIEYRKLDLSILSKNSLNEDNKILIKTNLIGDEESTKDLGNIINKKKNELLKKPLGHTIKIGDINGLELYAVSKEGISTYSQNVEIVIELYLKGNFQYSITSSVDDTAQGRAIGQRLNNLDAALNEREKDLDRNEKNLIKYNQLLIGDWSKQNELDIAISRQKEINLKLNEQIQSNTDIENDNIIDEQIKFSIDIKQNNSVGKETTTPQDKKEVSKIIEFFNKMFGFDGFAPFSEFNAKLKSLGYDSLQDMVEAKSNEFLKTPSGKVLGFVSDGKIYLNPNALTAKTAFHELAHVQQALIKIASQKGDAIAKAVMQRWDRLMKDNDVIGQVRKFSKGDGKRVIKIADTNKTHEIDLSATVYDQAENESDADYEERIMNESMELPYRCKKR
jgi:N12 class adenine-specific DNA methylase